MPPSLMHVSKDLLTRSTSVPCERALMSPSYALAGDMPSTAAEPSFGVSAVYPQQSFRYQRSHLKDSASISGERRPPASVDSSRNLLSFPCCAYWFSSSTIEIVLRRVLLSPAPSLTVISWHIVQNRYDDRNVSHNRY